MDKAENELLTRVGPGTPMVVSAPLLVAGLVHPASDRQAGAGAFARRRPGSLSRSQGQARLDRALLRASPRLVGIRPRRRARHPLLLSRLEIRSQRAMHRDAARARRQPPQGWREACGLRRHRGGRPRLRLSRAEAGAGFPALGFAGARSRPHRRRRRRGILQLATARREHRRPASSRAPRRGLSQLAFKHCQVDWDPTWYGLKTIMHVPGLPKPKVDHFIFPSTNRFTRARVGVC